MNETRASLIHFELDRHGVVEASAGTGKTYTIERLVLRLLTDEAMPIERILVVTFTEKATGELKTRLRRMLEEAIEKDDNTPPCSGPPSISSIRRRSSPSTASASASCRNMPGSRGRTSAPRWWMTLN